MRKLLLAALFAAAVPFAVSADDPKPDAPKTRPEKSDPDAVGVVEKAIVAHGGKDALEKYPASTSKMKGQMAIFGLDIDFTGELTSQAPDKVRMQLDADVAGTKTTVLQIVNGQKTKALRNGAPEEAPKTDDEKKAAAARKKELLQLPAMDQVMRLTPLLDGKKFTLKSEKDEKVEDKDAAVVTVTAKDMKDVKLYFNKSSGLLVKTSRKGLDAAAEGAVEVVEESILSDYKEFSGVRLPTKTVVTQDGKKFMTMTLTDVKYMEKADAKLFAVDD